MEKIYFNFKQGFLMKLFMVALAMILCLSNVKAQDVTLLGSWTSGTTKAIEVGTKRLLVVTVTGETAVMNDITDLSLTYGGQVMTKQVSDKNGTTAFGDFSYIFTLNEAGIAAADVSGKIVPTWTTKAPSSGVDFFSAFYTNVDQTTPVSATSNINLNGTLATAPKVATGSGDMVLMSVAFAGQPRTPTYTTGFTEVLKNPNSQSWGSGIIAYKEADGTDVIPSITNSSSERVAVTAVVLKKAKNLFKTPVVLLGSWTAGTTKIKEIGNKRLLVVMVTGETAVMNDITDLSLTYGGQVMTKQVSDQNGTTAFGDLSYIFTLNEAGIAAADETGKIVPTWTTKAPSGGFDIFSAFYNKVDQTTPVSATSKVNLNGTLATAPAVAAATGDMVLMSVAFAGQPRTPTYTTGFTEVLKNPSNQTWGTPIIAFKEGDGTDIKPSITNSSSERVALTAIVLKQGEEEGVPPTYYNLTANATNGGTVTVDPKRARYEEGTVVKVKAIPNFGYYFANWSDSLNSVVAETSIKMNSNKTITANFVEKTKYKITTEVSNGNIFLTPAGGTYYEGVEVTVLVKSNVGYEFSGWGGDLSGMENPQKIVVNSNKLISAKIDKIPAYKLVIHPLLHGTIKVTPNLETYKPGSAVILIATPDEGYYFDGWWGDQTGTQNPTSMVMNSDKSLVAFFEKIPTYTLTIGASTNGSVSLDPAGGTYQEGTVVTIKATANPMYKFIAWSGDKLGSVNPETITMNGNVVVNAEFALNTGANLNTIPEQSMLLQNYPNPFSTITTIPYQLNEASNVKLSVFNLLGEKVKILVNAYMSAGLHEVVWDARDYNGKQMSKGIYFFRLEIGKNPAVTRRSVLIR